MSTETTTMARTNDKLTGNASVGTEFVATLMEGCNILKLLHIQVSPHGTLKRNGHSLVRNSRTLAADLPEKSNLRMWQRLDRCCGAVLSVAADITRAVSSRRDNDPPKHETSRLMLLRMNAHRRANLENFLGTHDVVEGFGRPFGSTEHRRVSFGSSDPHLSSDSGPKAPIPSKHRLLFIPVRPHPEKQKPVKKRVRFCPR